MNQLTNNDFLDAVPIETGLSEARPATPADLIAQGMPLQQIKTEYQTAVMVQKPRSLDSIVARVLNEADYAGHEFYYSWPVKNRRTGKEEIIEGASIGAAMSLYREWGNCALDVDVKEEGIRLVFSARLVDLETGTTFTRQYRFRPTAAPGKYDDQRWDDMQFQVAQSKAIRNVVVSAMPKWLIRRMIERAKKAELAHIDRAGLIESRQKAVGFYARLGIAAAQIEAYFKKPQAQWGREDVALLRDFGRQIREGELDPKEVFPQAQTHEQESAANAQPAPVKAEAKRPPAKPIPSQPGTAVLKEEVERRAKEQNEQAQFDPWAELCAAMKGIDETALAEFVESSAVSGKSQSAIITWGLDAPQDFRAQFEVWQKAKAAREQENGALPLGGGKGGK